MSYNWGKDEYFNSTPRIRDIWALQALYGPSTLNQNDTTYGFDGYGPAVTIVDSGGINTFEITSTSLLATSFSYLNLNAGDIRSVVWHSPIRTEGNVHRVIGGEGKWRHVVHGSVTHGNEIDLSRSTSSQHVFTAGYNNLVRFNPRGHELKVVDCRSAGIAMVPGTDVIMGFGENGRLQVEDNIRWGNITFSLIDDWRHSLYNGSTLSTARSTQVKIDTYPQSIIIAGEDQPLTPCHFIGKGDLNPEENGCKTSSFSYFAYMQAILGIGLAFRKEFFSRVGSAVQAGAVRVGLFGPAYERGSPHFPALQVAKVLASMVGDAALLAMRQRLPITAIVHDLMQIIKWNVLEPRKGNGCEDIVERAFVTAVNIVQVGALYNSDIVGNAVRDIIPIERFPGEFYAVPDIADRPVQPLPELSGSDSLVRKVSLVGLNLMNRIYVVRQLVPFLFSVPAPIPEEMSSTARAAYVESLIASALPESARLRQRRGEAGQRGRNPVIDVENQHTSEPATAVQGKGILCCRRVKTVGKVHQI